MTRRILFVLAAAFATAGLGAAEKKAGPAVSAYEQAVQAYVKAVQAEVTAFQVQYQAATKDQTEEATARYAGAAQRLERLERAAQELERASSNQFDARKLAYEQARGQFTQALEQAEKTRAAE